MAEEKGNNPIDDKKAQDQRNVDNNANNIKNAADVAIATKNPYAVAAGTAVKAADKLTGGKSTQALGKVMNKANKIAPGGKKIQKASNKMSESGASDKIGQAAAMKNGMKSGGGGKDVPQGLKNPNPDGVQANNGAKQNKGKGNGESGGLAKKDGLEKKKGLDDKDSDDKKSKNKKGKGKDSDSSGSSEGKSGSLLGGKKKSLKATLLKLKIIGVLLGIAAVVFLVVLAASYLTFVWDSFMTAVTTFFGIKEGGSTVSTELDPTVEEEGLWVEDKYFKDDEGNPIGMNDYTYSDESTGGEEKTIKGIITVLREDSNCPREGTIGFWFTNFLTEFTGNFGGNTCRLLNYIYGASGVYEKKYDNFGLNIDESVIISTIFYGYNKQAGYISYDDPDSLEIVSASQHYEVLEDILYGGAFAVIKKDDVDTILKSMIFEEVWPYWRWKITPRLSLTQYKWYQIKTSLSDFNFGSGDSEEAKISAIASKIEQELWPMSSENISISYILSFNLTSIKDLAKRILNGATVYIKRPVLVGECHTFEHSFFYFSKEKWELFLRYNTNEQTGSSSFGIAGYVGSKGDSSVLSYPILKWNTKLFSPEDFNFDLSTLYGSGWVYDTNMNNSWINSSEPCNGTMTESEILSQYKVDMLDLIIGSKTNVRSANTFYQKREFTAPISNFVYSQKIQEEDLYTTEKDKLIPVERKYTDNSINWFGSAKSTKFDFDYTKGYAYTEFPSFKKASDLKLPGYEYNEIISPKKVEVVIQHIIERKDEFNQVLGNNTEATSFKTETSLTIDSYCEKTQKEGVGKFEVIIYDCEGKPMATRSFKEYILGVTLGEIGYVGNDSLKEYVKSQMVAAISYTLGRRNNYQNSPIFKMKSGSCDQNWCDIYQGCSRSEEGGAVRENKSVLLATYPGVIKGASTTATCFEQGITGKKYWKCAMRPEQVEKYSELFEEALDYVVASGASDFFSEGMPSDSQLSSPGFNGAYTASTQGKWKAMASEGKSVEDIMKATYPSSNVFNCVDIARTGEPQYYEWPEAFPTTDGGSIATPQGGLCTNYNSQYNEKWNKKVLEVAYRLAGSSIGDCSTFVKKVLRVAASELGMNTPGYLSSSTEMFKQYGRCNCANPSDLKPGDLVFHRTNPERWGSVGHVAIFAGYDKNGKQLVFESNTRNAKAATGSLNKGALVVDRNAGRIAGYVRWYPGQYNSCG